MPHNTDDGQSRFDQIENYDEEIPIHVAEYLNEIKTGKSIAALGHYLRGQHNYSEVDASQKALGIDLGCGTGEHIYSIESQANFVAMDGLDFSRKQLMHAMNKKRGNQYYQASMSTIPVKADHYDFACAVNSLHHLPSVQSQKQTFDEVYRVLKPGGVFIIHEINTINPIIKFYMKYVFPKIRNIDDGSEIWLSPKEVKQSKFELSEADYFTFVPDFTPKFLMGFAVFMDRLFSRTVLSIFGAHVMYVLTKPAGNNE
jgi:SAM-dependent methyltransferase